MDDDDIFEAIKKLGHINSRREELQKYCKSKTDQILKYLPRRILKSDGANLLDCILNGFTENSSNFNSKVKVIDIVLKDMREEATRIIHCGDVISRLCLELPRLPVDDLLRWCNDSMQSIVDDSDVNMIWRDIIPECLYIISAEDQIKHCGTDMSGVDYKIQCVHTLCQCRWTEKHLVRLAAMFKDLELSRNEHRQVVNKLCSYVVDVPPETLPPLVHQLLKLCKTYNLEAVLSHVSHYFSLRLYNKLEPPQQDSEATTIDMDDIVQYSPVELSRSLSTCLYHMSQGAADPELVRKHIKQWPKTQLLRAPMLVDLALALSDKGSDFKSICLNTIKAAIEVRVVDEIRSKESAWVRSLLPPDVDVANLLKVLTTESDNHRQLTVVGLINLAFVLLGISKTRPAATSCWSYGKLILARLCRSQPEIAPHVLAQIGDRLAADSSQRQYSDCLYVLCKLTPVAVERCTQLSGILEGCQPAGDAEHAYATYRAVRPLIGFSTRVRDTLVMICRKGLYSRDSAHRRLALSGFLTVLRHVKLGSGICGSQPTVGGDENSSNSYSYFTQLTVDLHASQSGAPATSRVRNENMCLEVVSILRRCLVQDAAVKQLLYSELYECIKEKVSLHESVLEMLYEHLVRYLPEDNDQPLLLDKCVQLTSTGAVLLEPIGRLLFVVAQFLRPVEGLESDDVFSSQHESANTYMRDKLLALMEKLCQQELYTTAEMEDPGVSDLTPESKAKALKVQQVLQCYEALIAHRLMQWTPASAHAHNVYKMYKDCNQILENIKVSPKNSKKGKSFNDTMKSQKSQKSQKEKGKAPTKMSTITKDRAGPFKPLPCLWSMQLSLRLLQLFYSEEVPWSSLEQRNVIRSHGALHVWALRCVAEGVRVAPPSDRQSATGVLYIAKLLYSRCLSRFQDMCAFDERAALASLELFATCLDVLAALHAHTDALKLNDIYINITGLRDMPLSASVAQILGEVHAALELLRAGSGTGEGDALAHKLVRTATVLLEAPVEACAKLNAVTVKLEDYVRVTSKQECLLLIPPLLTAAYRHHREMQLLDELIVKLTSALGVIDEEETSTEEESAEFPAIDARSGHAVLGHVCAHVRTLARAVDHVLARARDLSAALGSAPHHQQQRIGKELKDIYEDVVIQLCQLSRCVYGVARLRWGVAAGGAAGAGEGPTSACVRLYGLLATLAKQLPPDMAQSLRLERLLKLCGKKLSSACDELITYAEASAAGGARARTTRLVPSLVLQAENFIKNMILLEKKAKLNYQQYLSLGTARDFRIKAPVLEEVLGVLKPREESNDDDGNISDAETTILSPAASDNENSGEDQVDNEEPPKSKRKKLN